LRGVGGKTLGVIGASASLPHSELKAAREVANIIGVTLQEIETDEMQNAAYVANEQDRCYHCKSELFGKLLVIAKERGYKMVYDGTNADDLRDHRPGRRAAAERAVQSPLLQAGLTKEEIRILSKEGGLPTWNKPEMACLASRIPTGQIVTDQKLFRVERAEAFLKSLDFRILRVRHHGDLARIELGADELERGRDMLGAIDTHFKSLGFHKVTLDPKPYGR